MKAQNEALAVLNRNVSTSLVVTNPKVMVIAKQLRWRESRLVMRVQNALTTVVEQDLYLELGASFRMYPESLANMLKVFRGDQPLQTHDLDRRTVGNNLVTSKFDVVMDKLQTALSLVDKVGDVAELRISHTTVARLVEVHGAGAEALIDSIMDNVDDVAQSLGFRKARSVRQVVGIALSILVEEQDPANHDRGRVDPLDVDELFDRGGAGAFTRRHGWNAEEDDE